MSLHRCPGLYCGRLEENEESLCGACPRGYRTNSTSEWSKCVPCDDIPTFYDWLYLGFMVLIALVFHWFFIDMVAMRRKFTRDVLTLHATALLEMFLASIITLLLTDPILTLDIRSCNVRNPSDWYTLFHNPTPKYETTLHCTQEAVYPLQTIVLILYGLALLLMLLIRPWVCRRCLPRQSKMSIYAALYFFPILIFLHITLGGVIYYAFSYITIILSVISIAAHFAIKIDQSMLALLSSTVSDARSAVILIGHWALHAYGIIAVTQLTQPAVHASLVALVPLPALFYILTARFTDPNKLHSD